MGEHRNNPRAIEADKPAPRFPPGTEGYGAEFEAAVELNKEKTAEMVALIDAAKAAGQEPRFAVPNWSPDKNPEWFDLVVYYRGILARPSPLAIDPRNIPAAKIRIAEACRIPFKEFRARADAAFANLESRGAQH